MPALVFIDSEGEMVFTHVFIILISDVRIIYSFYLLGSHDVTRRDGRSSKMSRDVKGHRDRYEMESMEPRSSRRHRDDPGFNNRREQRHSHGGGGDPMHPGLMEYKTLCASNLNPVVQDDEIRDVLLHQFERFGNLNVKIMFSGDQRLAYLNFKSHAEASDAKHVGKDMLLFDKKVHLDPVYGKSPVQSSKRRSMSPPQYNRSDRSFDGGRAAQNFPNNRRRDNFDNFDRGRNMGGGGGPSGGFNGPPPPNQMGGFDPQSGMSQNNFDGRTKERFPHHLDHMNPEDDDRATRTLFVGNLDLTITEHGLRRIFERYGDVEEIDIKRPIKGQGNAYAFVKFFNLDMAHNAKVDMSGQFIGKFQCKIGYGKVAATSCVWVGGLESWTTLDTIEHEFDRFGMIRRVARPEGKSYGYVLYDNVDAATAACQEMRGFLLPGQTHRIKTDYADIAHLNRQNSGGGGSGGSVTGGPPQRQFDGPGSMDRPSSQGGQFNDMRGPPPNRNAGNWDRGGGRDFGMQQDQRFNRRDNNGRFDNNGRGGSRERQFNRPMDDERGNFNNRSRPGGDRPPFNRGFSPSNDRNPDLDRHGNVRNLSPPAKRQRHSPFRSNNNGNFQQGGPRSDNGTPAGNNSFGGPPQGAQGGNTSATPRDESTTLEAESIADLRRVLPAAWSGALVLKNSAFAACMHLVSGDVSVVDTLMRDPTSTELPMLRITQRLRLDQPKLEEVNRQVTNSGPHGHAVLLAVPGSAQSVDDANNDYQQRPLRNLVSYLKQKEAAGVIVQGAAPGKTKENGVMHSFPPCSFGHEYLTKRAPRLTLSTTDEEYLVIIVVTGTTI